MLRRVVFAMVLYTLGAVAWGTDDDQRQVTVADLKADFSALYAGLEEAHYDLFVHRPKAEFDRLFDDMLNALDRPMSVFEAAVRFQRFVAYGKVAHARIDFPSVAYERYLEQGGRSFPIDLRIVDGVAYVGENYTGLEQIQRGDRLIAINGVSMANWLQRTAAHLSADTPYMAHSLLEFSFARYLWLELGAVPQFCVTLGQPGQSERVLSVPALTRVQRQAAADALGPKFELDGDGRQARMLEHGIAYLRPGPFYNAETPTAMWDNTAFVRFIDGAFGDFLAAQASALIVDLRDNPGGDSSFSDPLIAWFASRPFRFASAFRVKSSPQAAASNQARIAANPAAAEGVSGWFAQQYAEVPAGGMFELDIADTPPRPAPRFQGRVFMLVDRHTYSNAVNVAAIVQDYGFGLVLGEKTADMATTYGAMEVFRLPRTQIEVGFPKAHIIRPSGELRADGVMPDHVIASPIVAAAEDVVLAAALRFIRTEQGTSNQGLPQ